ncbi:MAG: hypothetical protein CL878_12375, partial [Dehalococcoidia bacterium]|nr:hypothetical protein [Dehalococcoidia bacterium]
MSFEQVTADVIEANEFPRLSQSYAVTGVPKIVVNDRVEILGSVPERQFVREVLRALPTNDEHDSDEAAEDDEPTEGEMTALQEAGPFSSN